MNTIKQINNTAPLKMTILTVLFSLMSHPSQHLHHSKILHEALQVYFCIKKLKKYISQVANQKTEIHIA